MASNTRFGETTWALVPVKALSGGKSRLDGVLSSDQRAALVKAMLADVLSALTACAAVARTYVVTPDLQIDEIACAFGAEVLRETSVSGYRRSVKESALLLERLGAERLVVIPADVPLADPAEIAEIIRACEKSPSVSIVPATADGGTNAICAFPPNAIDFRFGEQSFKAHCIAAREAGISPNILQLPGFALDIDRPSDLRELAKATKVCRSGSYARIALAQQNASWLDVATHATGVTIGS